jgi:capsular polysaccharide biosynthesis protein
VTRRLFDVTTQRPLRVAVVSGPEGASGVALRNALTARGADVVVVTEDVHVQLAAAGPFSVVVDLRGGPCGLARVREVFYHVQRGGCVLTPDGQEGLERMLAKLRSGRPRLAAETSATYLAHGWLWLVSRAEGALAKLDEVESARYIELRGSATARVVERRPGLRFESRCELSQNTSALRIPYEPAFEVPELQLRELEGAVCAPGQVVAHDSVLMPDTYRHHLERPLHNHCTDELAPLFARISDRPAEEPPLRRATFFHLDSEWRGLFGHAMTEQMSRLWALAAARRIAPDVKVLVGVTTHKIQPWELELWQAAGIRPEQLAVIRRPVRVQRLLTATPMFSMPAYVHPEIAEVWRRVGDELVTRAPEREYPRRVFMTRSKERRNCRNRHDVERLAEEFGFTVLRPETMSLPEQARTFREADVIAGFSGAGMFGALFATEPKRMITVTSRRYGPTNEYMIASVLGHRLDQLFCRRAGRGFVSPFYFDTDGDEGDYLRDLFAGL